MNYATTVERVNRLLIMLVRELYMKGDVDSAMSLTGMSSETICAIGEAPLDAIEELFNNVSTSLFGKRAARPREVTVRSVVAGPCAGVAGNRSDCSGRSAASPGFRATKRQGQVH